MEWWSDGAVRGSRLFNTRPISRRVLQEKRAFKLAQAKAAPLQTLAPPLQYSNTPILLSPALYEDHRYPRYHGYGSA